MICNTGSECFLTKIIIKGEIVYVKILWKNSEDHIFDIQIICHERSWSGKYSYNIARNFADNFDENIEEYSNNVKNALKTHNSSYTYDFTQVKGDEDSAKFSWKRTFSDSTAIMVHGFVNLKQDKTPETIKDVVDFILNENHNLQCTIDEYKMKTNDLNTELDKWKNEFNKLIDIKNSLESTLYAKFIELLNSKKRRIQLLEDHLRSYEHVEI